MPDLIIHPSGPLRGTVAVPGENRSPTGRCCWRAGRGRHTVHGWVDAEVCQATLRCVRALGVPVDQARCRGTR